LKKRLQPNSTSTITASSVKAVVTKPVHHAPQSRCEYCHDTGRVKVKNPSGGEAEVNCPLCSSRRKENELITKGAR
jgi:hypothetical protein